MRELERQVLLRILDNRWREHLYEMDYLREGIHLRGFAQIDPLVAYKNEGFSMFEELMHAVWEEFARTIFHLEVKVEGAEGEPQRVFGPAERRGAQRQLLGRRPRAALGARRGGAGRGRGAGGAATATAAAPAAATGDAPAGGGQADPTTGTVHKDEHEKIGRNDPCWCGSGKKYKKCHGA